MREEFTGILILIGTFTLLFANMFTNRILESEDKDVD